MKKQINIIPTDAPDTYRNALGYAWQDYANKVPGDDRRGEFKTYQQVILDLEAQGITCVDAKNFNQIPDGAEIVVRVDCMWCGGASVIGYALPKEVEVEAQTETTVNCENPGEEPQETASIFAMQERLYEVELDAEHKDHPGWCNKCHSFCYGDCEAS